MIHLEFLVGAKLFWSNRMSELSKIESALMMNDLSKLNTDERVSYYKNVCESLGLNPLTQPLAYIQLNGKLCLYAKRDAAEQLRKINSVSLEIISRETIGEVYVVTVKATDKSGRIDCSTGAVCLTGLKGESLANAYLKCETKAKRRVTLSICGLGLLDESEVETIPHQKVDLQIEEKKSFAKTQIIKLLPEIVDEVKRSQIMNLVKDETREPVLEKYLSRLYTILDEQEVEEESKIRQDEESVVTFETEGGL